MNTTDYRILVHSGTFAALTRSGDITGQRGIAPDGLFVRDARHLSRWQLTVEGTTPAVLVPAAEGGGATTSCVLTPPSGRADPPAHTVFREQSVRASTFTERLRLANNRSAAVTARLALTVDVDFADQFELRSDHRCYEKPHAVRTRETRPDGVEFGYRRREWHSRTTVTAHPPPDGVGDTGSGARQLVWDLRLPAHGSAEIALRVTAYPHGVPESEVTAEPPSPEAQSETAGAPGSPTALLPGVREGWPELARACAQGLRDLHELRVPARGLDAERLWVPAAGVPWFLALFGRDALLASLFALPYAPAFAAATLPALAATQITTDIGPATGTRPTGPGSTDPDPGPDSGPGSDPDSNSTVPGRSPESGAGPGAEPGKIVHEVRHGELAHFGQVPYGRYYGSVDATPLFLVLLGAYTEQTGDTALARRLEPHARAAVEWMFRDGGLRAHGYLRYQSNERGLSHQSWKDSPGAICFADGAEVKGTVTAAAPQGYAYDALCRTAWLARTVWADPAHAERLEKTAEELRCRFLRDFWMPEAHFPALALDGEGRRVDALSSDAGHLLWSGVLDPASAETVGRRLLEEDFFSGWGVRTVAAAQGAYHPLSYHRGSVWPHDNAVIALGLARYGMREQATEVARAQIAMAAHTGYRLPEAVAGYACAEHPHPVPYPHACSPQAWAAAAPLALGTAVREGSGD
ncbi:aminotransferase [Streptomyces sp. AJS327]|uniref:amylo-alpha-1,6-glucosidase n=1 Tax=Streptomyces sp. AJS327 TaxID=2545265 RepID=UPI0015DFE48F|nr:glycogen debranching N-terminal domain-containing protein [Streptomyces sp. AJS327]MBA0049920.1 aminotransferase [Streptomyces sp. AJS327]